MFPDSVFCFLSKYQISLDFVIQWSQHCETLRGYIFTFTAGGLGEGEIMILVSYKHFTHECP